MAKKTFRFGFTPQEHRISVLPSTIAGIVGLALTMFHGAILWPQGQLKSSILLIFGILGVVDLSLFDLWIIPSNDCDQVFSRMNAVFTSFGLGIISYSVTPQP